MHSDQGTLWRTDNHPKRLLLVRLDNIGDIVMLSPAIRAIKQSFPSTHLTLMASPAGAQTVPLLPWIDNTITWRAVWQDVSGQMPQDPQREQELVELLKENEFDGVFIFTSFSQSPYPPAYACYLAGIPVRIGQSKEFGGSLLTHWRNPPPDSGHQVDRNLALLDTANINVTDRQLELHTTKTCKEEAIGRLRAEGLDIHQPYIVAAPGASCSSRRYSINRFADVIRLLSEKSGLPIVIVGSQREKNILKPLFKLVTSSKKVGSLIGKTNVEQLAAIIQNSKLTLTNNSASLHIADAFQVPMVVMYSGTEYESQWKPRSSPFRLLRKPTDCSPCFSFECPYSLECLDIPSEEVVENALNLLRGTYKVAAGQLMDERFYPS
jgi:ADP-heptose:LPS heptosyltransferase